MTQIINPPADYQRQQPAADAAVQDDPNRLLFKLMLLQRGDDVIEVRAIQTPLGSQPHATIRVPFLLEELDAVLVALNDIVTGSQSLTDTQSEVLRQHCLLSESRLHARTLERIGQYLYKHLFVDDVQAAFQAAIGLARQQGRALGLQLFMDEDSVMLARYPWELLHDGRRSLLASNAVELRRHIAYPEATRQLHLDPPLNVLYVAPRPINLPPLSLATGQGRVPEQLRALERIGLAKITE
jgi:hypothetical protein